MDMCKQHIRDGSSLSDVPRNCYILSVNMADDGGGVFPSLREVGGGGMDEFIECFIAMRRCVNCCCLLVTALRDIGGGGCLMVNIETNGCL